ncbi:hypothetical protein EWH70_09495 [Amycolatopsis suaedae]|uniref:Uncharacterized protein n=2 Tax=Amycolatopsis suaedae TaxID=2510978 RepID=A0A4Q7JBS4_9PSEU|nr:hypothetical protein EWH70_09495 [Amycolatopsis suaedae]
MRRRHRAATGKQWRDVPLDQRRAWFARCEPEVRAELGIAADAVWRNGSWQPGGQADLFDVLDTDSLTGGGH